KHARLKPSVRCGYSLTRIADARNCPECGLAVRITLSGNSNLEWSSPGWQHYLAFAFALLAGSFFFKLVPSAVDWTLFISFKANHRVKAGDYEILFLMRRLGSDVWPIICG